jgi:DNA-binding IscR family transcriptional regulator
MEYVLNAFERKDQKPVSVEAVAYRLDMPVDFTDKILNHLVQTGLLCHTSEPTVGFVPSTDGTHITLDEVLRTIERISFAQPEEQGSKLEQVFAEVEQHLARYSLKDVLNPKETFNEPSVKVEKAEGRQQD